ncbi:Alkyl hydroperoxide reductase subunit C-like protein [uncultured Gammaproteobacteria bacterium]|jgi:peroxiredoxin (alkyl hydroperoxide reductase subunit C)|uniref:peroxiredoxin n=1 Tax=thiotrophic endosymbiont of Bathymodiolus puteoserpentis (Logatchev) TaxID=343240 RepID=UPI0010B7D514|nr:peroxiredoxin [thiotrophic endosymbiont of Bathymodiolus puteoserpentis (Logatchev)]CAC9497467.1 Alkyl hydroperoxide reductase subunit C-like protein [uncultured Gammaproteobacteria bacterium]CAC9501127.1 Alkyl hydroperoxide reductase subunit C-like protein [uncultured Gammaproteobacteria bacterium]CAC9572161.1 Alkyl hydroperoxide reductase subunit C-like protein [uncultured Gammaproteobacteria bacterium]CAC9597863.1 Alkyl hydroperoxide reductase subunit C-like protein [uncultured Gammaprote
MSVLVTQQAPDFTSAAVLADGSIVDNFTLSSLKGKKIMLFFYPLDFTFVCPSEILAHHHRVAQFAEKGVEVVGVSIDSQFTHNAWRNTAPKDGGLGKIDFPLVADVNHSIMEAYGIVHPAGVALRASFLIDENFDVRHQVVNDLPLGRNVDDMLRMVDALDFHTTHGEVCPAGWNKGDEGMKDTPEGVAQYLAKNADKL